MITTIDRCHNIILKKLNFNIKSTPIDWLRKNNESFFNTLFTIIMYFRSESPMTTFKTENRHGYSVKFSPNRTGLLAIATSQYYGFKGGGTLFLVTYDGEKCTMTKKHEMSWEDGLFDVVWSRAVESLLVTGSGDGTLQMWNYKFPQVSK